MEEEEGIEEQGIADKPANALGLENGTEVLNGNSNDEAISSLRFLTNPAFSGYTQQASGKDCDEILTQERKQKNKVSNCFELTSKDTLTRNTNTPS